MDDPPFRYGLGLIFSVLGALRIRWHVLAARHGGRVVGSELRDDARLTTLVVLEVTTFGVYLFKPSWIGWADLPLPSGMRLAGLALGAVAVGLFAWVHHHLGASFSARVGVREHQVLVTSGPYAWARHPMYTAFYLLHVAVSLASANAVLAVSWLVGLTAVVVPRIRLEEARLRDRFGPSYEAWEARTGRFLPRFGRRLARDGSSRART